MCGLCLISCSRGAKNDISNSEESDLRQLCNFSVNTTNKSMPMRVDKQTKVLNTYCLGEGNKVTLGYNAQILEKQINIIVSDNVIKESKKLLVNAWCTDKDQLRKLLSLFAIRFNYSDIDHKFLFKVDFDKNACDHI